MQNLGAFGPSAVWLKNLSIRSAFIGLKLRAKRHSSSIGISFLAQAVSSTANFAVGIFLVRTLAPEAYGWYGIGMGLALLYLGFGNALILTQMIVLGSNVNVNEKPKYYQKSFLDTYVFIGFCTTISFILIIGLYLFSNINIFYINSIVFSSAGTLINGFFVKYAYATAQEKLALKINIFTAFFLVINLTIANQLHGSITAEISLIAFGFAQFVGAIYAFVKSGMRFEKISIHEIASLIAKIFQRGRWPLLGVVITWVQSQSYVYVTGLTLGVAAVALLNAGRIIVTPFNLLLPALGNLMLPRLAEARLRGMSEIVQLTIYFSMCLVSLGISYAALVMFLGRWILPPLVGPAYSPEQLISISVGWCCVLVLQLNTSAASLGLQAALQFKNLSILNGVAAAVTVAVALPLSDKYGPLGAIIAIGIGEGLLGVVLWHSLLKKR